MDNINATIKDFQGRKLTPISVAWRNSIATPYQVAYHRAYNNFIKTLNRQANSDKLKIDLALTALSLCSGSLLTTVFAGVALKAVAGKAVVDFICRYNLNLLFKAALYVETNKTAKFIVGAVWDQAAGMLTSQTKTLFQQNAANFPCVNNLVQKPFEIEAALTSFVDSAYLKVNAVCEDILASNKAAPEKEVVFKKLAQSPFCNPPNSCPLPRDLADRIELTFYMKLILNSDWLVKKLLVPTNTQGSPWVTVDKKPISQVPGEKDYPKLSHKKGDSLLTPREMTTVEYDRIGQDIIDRMNQLCKNIVREKYPVIDSRMFGEFTSEKTLKKADEILKKIGAQNLASVYNKN
jgi:hypothetical protein